MPTKVTRKVGTDQKLTTDTERKASSYWWQDNNGQWHYNPTPGTKPSTQVNASPTGGRPVTSKPNYDASGTYVGKPKSGGVSYAKGGYNAGWKPKGGSKSSQKASKGNMRPSKRLSAAAERRAAKKDGAASNRSGLKRENVSDSLMSSARDRMVRKRRRK